MKRSKALNRLKRMVAWDATPTLSTSELDDLLDMSKRADSAGHLIDDYDVWEPSTSYAVGDRVVPDLAIGGNPLDDNGRGHAYECTVAGTSSTSEPTWPTDNEGTVVDGTVTWREDGSALWVPTYDLNVAAAEGWEWKAASVANLTAFTADGSTFHDEQLAAQCRSMARDYRARISMSIRIRSL